MWLQSYALFFKTPNFAPHYLNFAPLLFFSAETLSQ